MSDTATRTGIELLHEAAERYLKSRLSGRVKPAISTSMIVRIVTHCHGKNSKWLQPWEAPRNIVFFGLSYRENGRGMLAIPW